MSFVVDGPEGTFRSSDDMERTSNNIFIAPGTATNGEFGLFEGWLNPGQSAVPHYHKNFSESFYILSGTLTLQAGSVIRVVGPGDFVYIPPNGFHTFDNAADADEVARFLMLFSPGAPREDYFREMTELAQRTVPPTIHEIDDVARRHDQVNIR